MNMSRSHSAASRAIASRALAAFSLAAAAQSVRAQCGPQWLAPLPPVGVEGTTHAVCSWDPDGAGPLNPWLVVGGFIEAAGGMEANNVAAWDGVRWHSLNSVHGPTDPDPDAVIGIASGLASFDPDDDGPELPWLIAAGGVDRTSAQAPWGFHRWMGDHWEELLSRWPLDSGSIVQFDPDDDGPLPRNLVLAGGSSIDLFDGRSWTQVPVRNAPGLSQDVRVLKAITAWDPDGSGPAPRQIVGVFERDTTPDSYQLARWNGATWLEMAFPSPATGYSFWAALGAWDPDGSGPQREQLYFSIDKRNGSIDWFDGSTWHTMLQDFVSWEGPVFHPFDLDGEEPMDERLVVGRLPIQGVVAWNGTSLEPLPIDGDSSHPAPEAMCTWDSDGDGPLPARLVAAENMDYLSAPNAAQRNGVSIYDGHLWDAIGRGPSAWVSDLLRWTRDGHDVLIATGGFHTADGARMDRIGLFDGASWEPMPTLHGPIGRLISWDADGSGSAPSTLVAIEDVEYHVTRVSQLVGGQWQALGNEMRTAGLFAAALAPSHESLYVIERDEVGTGAVLKEWDGTQWSPRGTFFGIPLGHSVSPGILWHTTNGQPLVVFAGAFAGADAVESRTVIAWDGQRFLPVGNGLWSTSGDTWTRVVTVDVDGDGPQPERLIAIGQFDRAGTSDEPFAGIAVLQDDAWRPVAVPPEWFDDFSKMTSCVWDPDGDGPITPTLRILGFRLLYPGFRATAWEFDGQTVRHLDEGATGIPASAVQWDPDGNGPIPPRIQVAGSAYTDTSFERGSVFEAFLDDATPWVATPPRDVSGLESDTITLTASVANGYAELDGGVQFQWRRDGVPIQDGAGGASANGGSVAGASGSLHLSIPLTLTITNAAITDSGDYDLVVTNSCGTLNSASAHISITPFCPADIDASGTIDAADLAAFFTAYETGDTRADVDRSGGVDGTDLGAFFAAYDSGC